MQEQIHGQESFMLEGMNSPKVKIYVHSVKEAVGTEQWGEWNYVLSPGVRPGGYRLVPDYKTYREPKSENVLPNDQKKFVEMVEAVASRLGFDVEIVDVARKKGLKMGKIPTLSTDSGEKLEGIALEEQVESFLAKVKSLSNGRSHQ